MAFIPAANTARVDFLQVLFGQRVSNTIWVRNEGGWSQAELETLCALLFTWWNDELALLLSNDIVLSEIHARDYTEAEGVAVLVPAPPNSGGNIIGAAMPGNVALVVGFQTGLAGRSRHGRVFVAGLSEDSASGNVVNVPYRDDMLAAFAALKVALDGAAYTLVVASFYHGTALELRPNGETRRMPQPRGAAVLTPVSNFTVDVNLDSQRRRLNGRGI